MFVRKLWSSPSLRSSILFGVGGLGFAGANIVLARGFPGDEYGLVVLLFALIQIGVAFGPAGADSIIIRRRLEPRLEMLRRTMLTSALVALATAAVGGLLYPLGPLLLVLLALAVVAGSANSIAGAYYQSRQKFSAAVALFQTQNFVLLGAAVVCVATAHPHAWLAGAALAAGLALSALLGWTTLRSRRDGLANGAPQAFPWREGIWLVGVQALDLLMLQMERVLIPRVLTLDHLATYAILAALAASPYRLLQLGIRHTMLARLSNTGSVRERRVLLWREGLLLGSIIGAGSILVWFLTPPLARLFLAGKYELTSALILAAIVAGILRVLNAFLASVVTALGGMRQLGHLNLASLVAVAAAVAGATVGARWGIVGVIYGVSLGWSLRIVASVILATPHLRSTGAARP